MMPELPANDVAEISLFGTGGGYGESLVIHLGNQNWIVTDSCCDPETGQSLPLQYLKNIGIQVQDVKLIVCTHWHDDHIRGLSQLVETYPHAATSFSWCHKAFDLALLIELDHIAGVQCKQPATKELKKSLESLQKRAAANGAGKWINRVPAPNRTLFPSGPGPHQAAYTALSPADAITPGIIAKLVEWTEKLKQNPALNLILEKPNMLSVAAWVMLNSHAALLGADLEVSEHADQGWNSVLNMEHTGKAGLFKIPHHGSVTGYDERVWQQLLHPEPLAVLTAWTRNKKLPQPEMIETFKKHTSRLYITGGQALQHRLSEEEKTLAAIFAEAGIEYKPVVYQYGHVRCRINMNNPAADWEVLLNGTAVQL